MASVRLEIDGRRVVADSGQTILEVARAHGFPEIPTLCNDAQLEPFASCFVCVVKVKGARTLQPACSTRVTDGMVVETRSPDVLRSRKAALELLLSNHYADCVGPCQLACPANVDIQGYVALAAAGKHRDAVRLIKERNPLPSVCGRICTRPCEVKGCRRNLLDEPVAIDWIKRYVADLDLEGPEPYRPEVAPRNGHRVAVVGSGPAGLSCAYFLAIRGYQVDIFESLPEAGGMLRYGIPEYRLPKKVLDAEIGQILSLGVTLRTNVSLGRDFTIKGLKEAGYGAIFLGLGAWSSSLMRVEGEDAQGVLSGIDFLKDYGLRKPVKLHGKVLVVGGGNTAIDCARTALRSGAAEVRIVYRRTRAEMPANAVEVHDAEQEGVAFDFLVAPTRVITANGRVTGLECQRMELGAPDRSGRRSPVPIKGSEFVMDCDFILAAIGQGTRVAELTGGRVPDFLPAGERLELTRWQTIQAGERSGETSVAGVFSAGDVVTGAATAIEAIAGGRRAAHAIDAYLRTGVATPEPVEFLSRKDTFRQVTVEDLRSLEKGRRPRMPALPPAERIRGFAEVETGLPADAAAAEAMRCQECGCQALFSCDLRRYATEYGVDVTRFLGEAKRHPIDRSHPLIELDQNKCIACGRCVRMCSEVVGISAYGYVNRGFDTVIRPALGDSLLDTDCNACGLCIGTCPTGAIVQHVPLPKPGPWRTVSTPTVCHYCGVGCRLLNESFGDTLVKVSRAEEDGVTMGGHCRKGRFGYGHVHARDRLLRARVGTDAVSLAEALDVVTRRLREASRASVGGVAAVFVSQRLTNEEAYLAQKLARAGLGTHLVTSFASLLAPDAACPEVVSSATYDDLATADVIVVVGSALDEEHFVADLLVKRAIRRGGKLVYVHPGENRVSRVAEVHLRCRPGTQAAVLAALAPGGPLAGMTPERAAAVAGVDPADLAEAAALVAAKGRKVVVFNRDFPGVRIPGDARVYAAVAGAADAKLLALDAKANAQGVRDMGCDPRYFPGYMPVASTEARAAMEKAWGVSLAGLDAHLGPADLAAALRERRVRVAVVIGEDPLESPDVSEDLKDGLLAADLLVALDLFETRTVAAAHVALPMSAIAETSGTFTSSERRVQSLARSIRPAAGLETWQVLDRIGAGMGIAGFDHASTAAIFDEIRSVAPMYRTVRPDATDESGRTDISAFSLRDEMASLDGILSREPAAAPQPLSLDVLEVRFAAWYEGLMAEARARRSVQGAVPDVVA